MRNIWRFSVLVGIGLGSCLISRAAFADGMRCGNRIVSTGDSTHQVRSVCGAPDDARSRIATRTEKRKIRVPCAHGSVEGRCERVEEHSIDVVIDEWTYDFGRRRFVHYLTFIDGKLASVETGSYGTDK